MTIHKERIGKRRFDLMCRKCKIPLTPIDYDLNLRQEVLVCRKCGYVKIWKAYRTNDKRIKRG